MKIKIQKAPQSLTKYTHSSLSLNRADSLVDKIKTLEKKGINVFAANGSRSTVPICYRGAYKMNAPFWVYEKGEIKASNAKLENRTRGSEISADFIILGSVSAPSGFRCSKRTNEFTILRSK